MGKRYGRQEPVVWSTLPHRKSNGKEAIDAYNQTGRTTLKWQQLQIKEILATDSKGNYVHRKYGLSVPRRNGKTEVFLMRELYALFHGEKVLHTAHLTTTSSDAASRLAECLAKMGYEEVVKTKKGEKYDKHFVYRKQYGLEVISLLSEGSGQVSFRTRTSRGGLGQRCDVLIIDEAQEYLTEQENTLKFLVSDSKNRQILMCGTPPTAVSQGTVFKSFRDDVLSGKSKYSGWAEWSVPIKSDPRDKALWYECNPSLGYIFDEDAVELEIGSDDIDFNIQRLGLWIDYNLASAITETEWRITETNELPKLTGSPCIGIKYGSNGMNAAMSMACKTEDGRVFVSSYDMRSIREGNGWIIGQISRMKHLDKVVVDGKGKSEILAFEMKQSGLKKPVIPTGSEYILANNQFEQAVYNNGLYHMPQPALDVSVTNCEKKKYGSRGGFIYVSNIDTIDITIMDSVILAFWACYNSTGQKGQRVGY